MANPIGEENWLAYLEEIVRNASDLEQRVNAVEHYKHAISSEPGSLRIWLAYCNYFWSLWEATQISTGDGWSDEERMLGRELFTFNAALDLWQQGYVAIRYRLGDSHLLWDRWISLEMELLAKTKTPEGIKRITHLYRDRLLTPHLTWDETSQNFSHFLTEYNYAAYEDSMKDVTTNAQETKRLIAARDPYETALKKAVDAGDIEAQKAAFNTYLEWEMLQSKRSNDNPEIGIDLCRGLYARALTGALATDQNTWYEYVVFLSSSNTELQAPSSLHDVLQRAVQHCPWSGLLWNRYIMCAEEAKRPFSEVESIKHAATSEDQLLKDGMEGMIEMYVAWCGFLKRNAMDATASDEAVDVADVGLGAALEDVSVVGQRLYGKDFQGDPKFRLERIYIQYLTEKKGAVDEARAQWNKLASLQIHADNHDFWFRYYMWEMLIFSSAGGQDNRSPTPSSGGGTYRIPTLATAVLARAVARRTIDWPEKVLEVYMQHCNDYEMPLPLRKAADRIHKTGKEVKKRREREDQEKAAAYAAYYTAPEPDEPEVKSPGGSKRKRGAEADPADEPEGNSKRQKNEPNGAGPKEATSVQPPKRDRENATIIVSNLPGDVTQTKVRQYFKDYGHINNVTALVRDEKTGSSTALIEFSSAEEAQSALLKDGRYMNQSQLSVKSGHDLTVYVTNYPPAADQNYIRDLFKDCGEILSIRWPSLKVNTHRRFCYVSFQDQEASAKAVKLDGTVLEKTFKLVVKYSDPGHKKAREGALAEGREIHINNLDRSTNEKELKDVFSKYGKITRVNIPLTLAGKNKGFAFMDFETKEEAAKAVAEMNNTNLKGHVLAVALSKESKVKPAARTVVADNARGSPAPSSHDAEGDQAMQDAPNEAQHKPTAAEISARTVALMGLPDTVNDARIRALVEPLGSIIQMTVKPGNGGAEIEFADAATAGKASLQLDSMEFDGHKIRTGTPDELRRAKAEHAPDRIISGKKNKDQEQKAKGPGGSSTMFIPATTAVRRPVLGKPGPRRGLGFKPSGAKPAQNGDSDTSVKKSNADFKAMFLASGKTEEKKEDEGEVKKTES
ncbi:Splicing factor [Fusarium irregulare]|uniref:U4/U6 snRNA-associated-splicing factor PRP24 n=1 Tax=Fusarium irregulare TaxID=2494466 RepID=A0A9W8UET7_9HYPO|nr:Splicing factor [Fusarium irregulare]KAJ4028545.1 Splicing factor [Fusarium irregulare]